MKSSPDESDLARQKRDAEDMAKLYPDLNSASIPMEGIGFEPKGIGKIVDKVKSYYEGDGPVFGLRLDGRKGISVTVKWRF